MLIPRERNLVRFYVQLSPSLKTKSLQEQRNAILSKIEEILRPYLFSTKIVEWTSLYSVRSVTAKHNGITNAVTGWSEDL